MAREDVKAMVMGVIPSFVKQQMEHRVKVIEIREYEVANAVESTGEYYIDRFSESRNCYIMMRRERQK